jgi:hypothetical protein
MCLGSLVIHVFLSVGGNADQSDWIGMCTDSRAKWYHLNDEWHHYKANTIWQMAQCIQGSILDAVFHVLFRIVCRLLSAVTSSLQRPCRVVSSSNTTKLITYTNERQICATHTLYDSIRHAPKPSDLQQDCDTRSSSTHKRWSAKMKSNSLSIVPDMWSRRWTPPSRDHRSKPPAHWMRMSFSRAKKGRVSPSTVLPTRNRAWLF